MNSKEKLIEIDTIKLKNYIAKTPGMTQQKLCYAVGRANGYLTTVIKTGRITRPMIDLICTVLKVEVGYFDKKEVVSVLDTGEAAIQNIYDMMIKLQGGIAEISEKADGVYAKLNTNTIQLERVRENTAAQLEAGTERAARLLRRIMTPGNWISAEEIVDKADQELITKEELLAARDKLGIGGSSFESKGKRKAYWKLPKEGV